MHVLSTDVTASSSNLLSALLQLAQHRQTLQRRLRHPFKDNGLPDPRASAQLSENEIELDEALAYPIKSREAALSLFHAELCNIYGMTPTLAHGHNRSTLSLDLSGVMQDILALTQEFCTPSGTSILAFKTTLQNLS